MDKIRLGLILVQLNTLFLRLKLNVHYPLYIEVHFQNDVSFNMFSGNFIH